MSEYLQNRLLSLQHDFRRSTVWSFQSLDRLIKNDFYFRHQARGRQQSAAAAASATPDPAAASGVARGTKRPARDMYAEHFGRVDPRHIPESESWWKARQTEVTAVGDDHELGQMTHMVTVTQNDLAPELIAHARRGPCAVPTQEEKFAYLLTRRAPSDRRPNIQEDATAAVLSYQRRMHSVNRNSWCGTSGRHWASAWPTGIARRRRRERLCTATCSVGTSGARSLRRTIARGRP